MSVKRPGSRAELTKKITKEMRKSSQRGRRKLRENVSQKPKGGLLQARRKDHNVKCCRKVKYDMV